MPYADRNSVAAIECRRRASRKHYHAHKDEFREAKNKASKQYFCDHRESLCANQRGYRRRLPVQVVLFKNAQQRARVFGLEFSLTMDDIVVPEFCPVLGLKLAIGDGHAKPYSPSL